MLATFAAGCFWGVEATFAKIPGVLKTEVGYTGGDLPNPTYEQVCTGKTHHAEALQLTYDPDVVSYDKLLETFWTCHNPTTLNRQGLDVGTQYRSEIFYHTEEQKRAAEHSKELMQISGNVSGKIVTEIKSAAPFYRAEEYHQKYLAKKGGFCH